jgi:hypothetical protein
MILSPPIDETSTPSPSYRISATLNLDPLLPVSYVTRVDMLALDGEEYFVGEFEYVLVNRLKQSVNHHPKDCPYTKNAAS